MICKYCGSEIPDDSRICFVCNKNINNRENIIDIYKIKESDRQDSIKIYKEAKKRFIGTIITIPFYFLVLWIGFMYINPIVSIISIIIAIILVSRDLKKQYNIMKGERIKWD